MMRWSLLGISIFLVALSVLTWVPAPTLLGWKLAILAGEFGHYLGALALLVALLAWVSRKRWSWLMVVPIVVTAIASTVGFFRPTFLARKISHELPQRLSAAFGPIAMRLLPFDFTRLVMLGGLKKVPVETLSVSGAADGSPLLIDFYRAENTGGQPSPCILLIHGGGWDGGDRSQLPWLNHRLVQLGYSVAAVSYRLAPKTQWPGQRDDIIRCFDYLKSESARLGIDRSRFVFFGRSAGGQLAASVGYALHDRSIRGVIVFYTPYDLKFAWDHSTPKDALDSFKLMRQYLGGSPEEKPEAYQESNAHAYLSPRTPATLLIHGQLDTLVWHRHSVRLNDSLAEVGVPHYFISLPWATHGFDFNLNGPGGQISTYAVEHFLAAVTR